MLKRSTLTIVFILILSTITLAGNIYPIDFSKNNEHNVELALNEGIEIIEPKGIIIFDKINKDDSVNLKFFRSDNRLWGTFNYRLEEPKDIDMDIDHKDDFIIRVLRLQNNKIILNIRAYDRPIVKEQDKNLAEVLEKQEENIEQVTDQVITDIENKPKISIGFLITALIVIVGLLTYFFFVRKKST